MEVWLFITARHAGARVGPPVIDRGAGVGLTASRRVGGIELTDGGAHGS